MIKQSLANNDGILEKKFKILRTSIMLGNLRNKEEAMSEYEETARELDEIKKNVYEELLASKMYTTTSLEDEQQRLISLIELIDSRIKERNDFIDDYIKITSNFLDNLPKVSLENELTDYKLRLDNINEYLMNCNNINELNSKIKKLRDELQDEYENKANNEIINDKLEEELIDEFNKVIASNEYYSKLNYTDIEDELDKINSTLLEKKDVMDTFVSSYEALTGAGISGAEREEYLSYVQDAKSDYYHEIDKKFMLDIYKLVLDKENDYDKLYFKRENIYNILNERLKVRDQLDIINRDEIEYFASLCEEQFSVIKSQKFNMENIDKLILEITECEGRLENLERANERKEIVELLDEYSVEKMAIEKVELPLEEDIHNEVIKSNLTDEVKPSNMIIRIQEPKKMNVKNASDTAKLVMKKVVIVLEPKKFLGKKDKLREAELELEERKRKDKILLQEKKIQDELKDEKNDSNNIIDDSIDNNLVNEEIDDSSKELILNDGYMGKIDEVDSSDSNDSMIELNTSNIFEDGELNNKLDSKIEINFPDSKEISIPTEIFIEEPVKEETVDLFKETDPFLDDNEFEINNQNSDKIGANMPTTTHMGTVKPNNMLSKIEEVVLENDDIILPTLGLTKNENKDVPIVSENYIN